MMSIVAKFIHCQECDKVREVITPIPGMTLYPYYLCKACTKKRWQKIRMKIAYGIWRSVPGWMYDSSKAINSKGLRTKPLQGA